jgi:hypothetical protein
MALIPCPECAEQVSERAPTCPKCGTPISGATSAEGVKAPSGETTYYSDDRGVRVTNARAIIDNKTYSMANISSVSLWEQKPSIVGAIVLIAFGALQGLACISTEEMKGGSLVGILMVAIGIMWLKLAKSTYFVRLTAAGGETNALASHQRPYIEAVVNAMNEAIIKRG